MAKYHKVMYALIAQCRQNKDIEIQFPPVGNAIGLIDGKKVVEFTEAGAAIAWLKRAEQSLIDGGDVMTVIDDY